MARVLLQARHSAELGLQNVGLGSAGVCDDVIGQIFGNGRIHRIAQILAEHQNQADSEDTHKQREQRCRGASTLAPDIAQGHLDVRLPGARHQDGQETYHAHDKKQIAKGRQHQGNQKRDNRAIDHQSDKLEVKTFRHRQAAHQKSNQAEKAAQEQQEKKRAIDGADSQDYIVENNDRHHAEQRRENQQQRDGQGNTARAVALRQIADYTQGANTGGLYDRHQTKDQGGEQADQHATGDDIQVEHERDLQ